MRRITGGPTREKGFTLLELAIVLAGLSIITTAAIPYFIRQAEVTAAHRTSKEVASIQEAAKWYYVANKAWPTSVAALQAAGYLNPSWSGANPWGNPYLISSNSTSLTVTTTLPDTVGGALSRALPGVSYTTAGSERTTNSVIPVPGQEASLATVAETANTALEKANQSALPPQDPRVGFPISSNGNFDCQNLTGQAGWVMVGVRTIPDGTPEGRISDIYCRQTVRP